MIAATDVDDLPELPGLPLQPPRNRATLLLRKGAKVPASLAATLAAVGADRVTVTGTDPRTADDARDALRTAIDTAVLAVGAGFGASARFAHRVRTARHAHELPGGGLLPFPARRMVALYGHPQTAALGMLGEQSAQASVRRAARLAAAVRRPREGAGGAGLRAASPRWRRVPRRRTAPTRAARRCACCCRGWQAAEQAGTYVVLDLQPGRDDFLTQAKAYEELLRRPWVGLALDPEWRLQPGEKPLRQIGHVGIDEVNAVGRLARRPGARARPAPEGADPAPVPPLDGARPRPARHLARRGAVARARRRPGRPEREAGHLVGAAARPAGGGVARLEELRGRGHPDAHPGADRRAGAPDAVLRVLPVAAGHEAAAARSHVVSTTASAKSATRGGIPGRSAVASPFHRLVRRIEPVGCPPTCSCSLERHRDARRNW